MAILFIYTTNEQPSTARVDTEKWLNALHKQDNQLDIRVWPACGNPEDIEFVIAWKYPEGELNKYPNLKCIASLGAGVDHIMQDRQRPKHIPVVRVVDPFMANEMTQYVVSVILHHIKRLDHWKYFQAKSKWHSLPPFSLHKSRVGILGLGFLGQSLAKILTHLEIKVRGWSRSAKKLEGIDCYSGPDELNQFLKHSDILVCLLPLTPQTENILNKNTLAQLPKNAYLINVARGNHLVEEDLIPALDSEHLSGACLDVFRQEPLPEDHPFWQHPKIRVTPHIASVTNPNTVASQIVENYHRMLKGKPLKNTVDLTLGY